MTIDRSLYDRTEKLDKLIGGYSRRTFPGAVCVADADEVFIKMPSVIQGIL